MTWMLSLLLATTPPATMTHKQQHLMQRVIEVALTEGEDPYELLAISWIESAFRPRAVSAQGDYGLMQINCKLWWEKLKFRRQRECEKGLFNVEKNVKAALLILREYRQYAQCQGINLFSCYNGGPGWAMMPWADDARAYAQRAREARLGFRYLHETSIREMIATGSQRICYDGSEPKETGCGSA